MILVTESVWHDKHDSIIKLDNLQLSAEDSCRVLTLLEYGIKPKRIQEIMNREADRVFAADRSSLSQADSSAYAQSFANSRERISMNQIDNLRKKAKRLQAVDASDAKATQLLLQHLQHETGAVLMHQEFIPEDKVNKQPSQDSIIIIAAPFQVAMLRELWEGNGIAGCHGGDKQVWACLLHSLSG